MCTDIHHNVTSENKNKQNKAGNNLSGPRRGMFK